MVRSRWAALALGCCALFISGCGNWSQGSWFSRFRTTSMVQDCECSETSFGVPGLEGGPFLTPPPTEGAYGEPPIFAPQTTPHLAPPPRIVPIPHAAPVPYSPTH